MRWLWCVAALLTWAGVPAWGQEGVIDMERSLEENILRLEERVNHAKDASIDRQRTLLFWLAELYEQAGNDDGVDDCYRLVIAYFPGDIIALNRYGRYLSDAGRASEADSVLGLAVEYGRIHDIRGLHRGQTHLLLATNAEDVDKAAWHARTALTYLPRHQAGPAHRALANAFNARGEFDEAINAYLHVVGVEQALTDEDLNGLRIAMARSGRFNDGDATASTDALITEARTAARSQRMEIAAANGGSIVDIRSDDVSLEGTYYPGSKDVAVLFVADWEGFRNDYEAVAQLVAIDGAHALTVDLRGHGDSRSDSLRAGLVFSPEQKDRLPNDIGNAVAYLSRRSGLDSRAIHVVAAGQASRWVELAMHRFAIRCATSYLSPRFETEVSVDYQRDLITALQFRHAPNATAYYARDDMQTLAAIKQVQRLIGGESFTPHRVSGQGFGTELIRANPGFLANLVERLSTRP